MTVSAIKAAPESSDETFRSGATPGSGSGAGSRAGAASGTERVSECTVSAEGTYAARLTRRPGRSDAAARGGPGGPARYAERWTLGGPEPYRVALPSGCSEEPGSDVLPMGDGRVLIHRPGDHRHVFVLLHPTNPGTREVTLGTVDCPACARRPSGPAGAPSGPTVTTRPDHRTGPDRPAGSGHPAGSGCPEGSGCADGSGRSPGPGRQAAGPVETDHRNPTGAACRAVRLLPPVPGGRRAYALVVGAWSTDLWLVAGDEAGPRRLTELPGRCTGGTWLERTGRLLAVDQEAHGRTKTVTVDLGRGCAVSPLLQIAEHSTDRLLLADPDSGLLLIRSDAPSPGHERLAWGVLGSTLPVRFPECLRLPDCAVTPFAIQPGQVLTPERCAVALRVDGAAGTWPAVWRPGERTLHHVPAPEGWLTGCGVWTREGVLHLPYATATVPCGTARLTTPPTRTPPAGTAGPGRGAVRTTPEPGTARTTPGSRTVRPTSGPGTVRTTPGPGTARTTPGSRTVRTPPAPAPAPEPTTRTRTAPAARTPARAPGRNAAATTGCAVTTVQAMTAAHATGHAEAPKNPADRPPRNHGRPGTSPNHEPPATPRSRPAFVPASAPPPPRPVPLRHARLADRATPDRGTGDRE